MSLPSPRRRPGWATLAATAAAGVLVVGAAAIPTASADSDDARRQTPKISKLAGPLAKQKLVWGECEYPDLPEATAERLKAIENVQCADVTVPLDWHDADNDETLTIKVSQAMNRPVSDARHKGTIFVNPGGPGGSGLPWAAAMQMRAVDLTPYYNFVGFDPRGIGQSTVPSCPVTVESTATDEEILKATGTCDSDPVVSKINTDQTTYDMDLIRHLLKEPKLSYIGYSYGTWLGAWYAKNFPANADTMLLDSAIDATQPTLQKTWDLQPVARDRQFSEHMVPWVARHDDLFGAGDDPDVILENYYAGVDANPDLAVLLWVLTGATSAFPDNSQYPLAGDVIASLAALGAGDGEVEDDPAEGALTLVEQMLAEDDLSTEHRDALATARADLKTLAAMPTRDEQQDAETEQVTIDGYDAFEAIRCGDGQWTQGTAYWEKWVKRTNKKAPFNALGFVGIPQCAYWQTDNLMPVADADTFPEVIVLQSELDSQTGYEGARRSGTKLPDASFIAVDNEGSHGLFPYGTECVDRPIYRYFLTGKEPRKDISICQALPLPLEDKTYESWGVLGKKGRPQPESWSAQERTGEQIADQVLAAGVVQQERADAVAAIYGHQAVEAIG